MLYKIIVVVLIIRMFLIPTGFSKTISESDIQLDKSLSYLKESIKQIDDVSAVGEWSIMALSYGDIKDSKLYNDYLDYITVHVSDVLSDNTDSPTTALNKHKATENSRVILALCALGVDPTNIDGYDLTSALTDTNWVCSMTLNSPIFALIALNACGCNDEDSKNDLISFILDKQLDDGGWALSGNISDPDITAMALQALSYHRDLPAVASSSERAIELLSEMQLDTGEYRSWGTINSESLSQVVIALTAWGIDPDTDDRFIKNGASVLDALLSFADPSGGFLDVFANEDRLGAGEPDLMASEQASLALEAYIRFKNGEGMIYSFSDNMLG